MSNIADELIDFRKRRPAGQSVMALVAMADEATASVIAINLLRWFRNCAESMQPPMQLPECKWASVLVGWISTSPDLRDLFVLHEHGLHFAEHVPIEVRLNLQKSVRDKYNTKPYGEYERSRNTL